MSHYKPYPAYKDSGVEWLGAIPIDWANLRFKWKISRNDGGVWGGDPDGKDDTVVLRSTEQTAEGHWKLDDPAPRKLSYDDKTFALLLCGDLLVTKSSGSSLHIGKTTIVSAEIQDMGCCYSNFMQRIRTRQSFLPKLAWYVMNSEVARRQFDFLSNTTTGLANLNGTMIGQIQICVPQLEEQHSIVAHLDHETAYIDGLVSRKTRFIELLREKRQALITHAVTKGLDPNAPMKDSGVEWLGDVPAHWDVTRVKYVINSIGQGWSPECESRPVDEGEWGVLKVGCVNGGVFRPTENKALPLTLIPRPELALKKGDVLVSRANTRELVGGCAVVEQDFPLLMICDKLYRLSVDNARTNPAFLAALIAVHGRREVELEATGASASMVNIAQSVILNLQVGLPPLDEQVAIIVSVVSGTQKYDTLISTTESSIELLKERRSALITAAVTGQIDLRETV